MFAFALSVCFDIAIIIKMARASLRTPLLFIIEIWIIKGMQIYI